MKRLFLYLFCITALFKVGSFSSGCATIVPPEGGPRDTLPPIITEARPVDSVLNFTGNRITFTFDEYVKLDNVMQNLIVSPIPRVQPTVTSRLTTVTVRLRDSLEANTTYSLNFGNSIVDVNESNPLANYTYVFSTGSSLDSLTFSGKVLLAETGEIDSTLIVMLHINPDDSAVINERPRYMARLDGKGNFTFRNLPSDTFYVYALKDETRSFRYMNKNVLFAFSDTPVVVNNNTRPATLHAYAQMKQEPASGGGTSGTPAAAEKRLRYTTSATPDNNHDLLQPFQFRFTTPLRNFDSSKISVSTDTLFTPLNGYTWSMDTTKKIVTLNLTWQPGTLYNLIFQKDFATDTLGQQLLKADTLSFTTRKPADYGQLALRLRNVDLSVNPVLQFVQNGQVMFAFPITGNTLSQDMFPPGEYQLRVLHDRNKNGIWNPGEFFGKRIQPELVKPIERKLNVRAGAKSEAEVTL
jgi:hypothetical protein